MWLSSARTSTAAGLSWATNRSARTAVIPPRGRTGCVGFYSSGVGDGATGLSAVQGVGEGPQRGGEFTDRAM